MPSHDQNFSDGKRLVLEAADIVRLIGETVKLKRAGGRYVGLCPFHNEKSPSFSVNPAKQFFYCFGCKKGGNVIDFVIQRDRVDFRDALQSLADWAGVDLPRCEKSPEQADKRKRLLEAHSAAAEIYRKLLQSPAGGAALEYLRSRGLSDEIIRTFGIGFAPEAWDTLAAHGLLKKYLAPLLEEAGLLKARQGSQGYYDTFRARVMFPIRDEQGRPIAFGGRVLPGGESPAKYLNSPETPLFSKGKVLFGLDLARKRMVETRTAIVFEGYADATMAHQFGVTNAVAVLGTALTPDHAQTLRRLADKIVLLFDADAAGGMAAMRSVELFLREPVEIAVADLPEGLDPDEFLQQHGLAAFQQRIEQAPDALEYRWRQLQRQFRADASVTGRQKAMQTYLASLAEARGSGPVDPMRWGAVVARVSKLLGMRPDELNKQFPRTSPAPRRQSPSEAGRSWIRRDFQESPRTRERKWRQEPKYAGPRRSELPSILTESAESRSQGQLLGALFNDPHLWHKVQAQVSPEQFTDRRYRWLAEQFWQQLRNEGEPAFPQWLDVVGSMLSNKPESADKARAACIELAELAESLGPPREVAAEAVSYFLRRKGGSEVDELLAVARRGAEAQLSGVPAAAQEEVALLQSLQEKVRTAGRAGKAR